MKRFCRRPFLLALAGVATLTGVTTARPTWPQDLIADLWSGIEEQREFRLQQRLSDELTARDEVVKRRLDIKLTAVRMLIDGQLTLPQAAAEFYVQSGADAQFWDLLHGQYPGKSDQECLCRNVMTFAGYEVEKDAARRDEVTRRLDSQLAAHLDRVEAAAGD
jgi:hypothetical protein